LPNTVVARSGFSGQDDALYELHLLFDDVVDLSAAGARECFEAAARSVRDVLSQRWILTESTNEQKNPKRIYYLSTEFLIGRSLSASSGWFAARPSGTEAVYKIYAESFKDETHVMQSSASR
jgi:glucan phosphorylase